MIQFNISPSALNLYLENEFLFFLSYILKQEPDSKVYECYGVAGSLVHEVLEEYAKNPFFHYEQYFKLAWDKKKIRYMETLSRGNSPLNKQKYLEAIQNGVKKIKVKYDVLHTEQKVEIPHIDTKDFKINIKGIIDVVAIDKHTKEKVIVDWKTSSSVAEQQEDGKDGFTIQAKFYCYLYYKVFNEIPAKVVFEYVKINDFKEMSFIEAEILEFEKFLHSTISEIISKGKDKNKYHLSAVDGVFNGYKLACAKEQQSREGNVIHLFQKNNKIHYKNIPERLKQIMFKKYSYKRTTYNPFTKKYQTQNIRTVSENWFPAAYLKSFLTLLKDYNEHFNESLLYRLEILRDEKVVSKIFDTKFKDSEKELREYQKEAIEVAIKEKVGIIYGGTSFGKTFMSLELIKKINKRTLFIVNRKELLEQTADEFEKELGVRVGRMYEGILQIDRQITVASIQTLHAILKRKNESTEQLKKYLYNVNVTIMDECQNVKDAGMYGKIASYLVNSEYLLGLSGSPFRNEGDDLEMNKLVGMVIYTKTTKDLEKENFITPTKCIFIQNSLNATNAEEYALKYKELIVENTERNDIIKNIVENFRDSKKILILVKSVAHGDKLHKLIDNSFLINGSTENHLRKQMFDDFKQYSGYVLVGSYKIFSAGVDIPDLDMIINAVGNKSKVDVIQIVGRVKRKCEGKEWGYYVDFCDMFSKTFESASKDRMRTLKKFGNEVKVIPAISFKNDG